MIILMIAASFTGSVLFTLLLRKMDKNNLKLAQIKRMGEIQSQQLDNSTREHLRSINDASLEFSTLVKQSRQIRDQLEEHLHKYEEKLNLLSEDREIVDSIAKELSTISSTARNVNDQSERIEIGLERMSRAEDEMNRIRNGLENLSQLINQKSMEADTKIHQTIELLAEKSEMRTDEILLNAEETIGTMKDAMDSLEKRLEDFEANHEISENNIHSRIHDFMESLQEETREKSDLFLSSIQNSVISIEDDLQKFTEQMEEGNKKSELIKNQFHSLSSTLNEKWKEESIKFKNRMDEFSAELDDKMEVENSRIEEKWILETGRLEEKFGNIENKLLERFHSLEHGLTAIRTTAVESIQNEVSRIRSDLDNFNLEAITRRDEILNETRRMAEGMGDQINLFQEKYLEAENRLLKFADQEKQAIRTKMESFEEEWNEMEDRRISSVEDKIKNMESMVDEIRDREIEGLNDEIKSFRDDFRIYIQEAHEKLDRQALQIEESLRSSAHEEELQLQKSSEKLEEMSISLDSFAMDLRQSLKQETDHSIALIRETRNNEEESIKRTKEEMGRIRSELIEKADEVESSIREIEKTHKRIDESGRNAAEELKEQKEDILRNLEERAMKFLSEQDVQLGHLTRTIDEKISQHLTSLVDSGQFKLDELEKRTSDSIRDSAKNMEKDLERARNDFRKIRDEVRGEMEKGEALKEEIFEELSKDRLRFKKFEDRLEVIDRAQELTEKLDETVEILTDRLDMAREENAKIDQYVKNLEAVRLSRKELERELQLLDVQRSKLADTENYISGINHRVEELHDRFDIIAAGEQMADRMEERVMHLSEYKDSFEKFFIEMSEKKKYIENAIRFIEKSKQQIKDAKDTSEKLLNKVERAEIRQIDMDQHLQTMESKTNLLNNMEDEIQKVEARFEQMEGLMKDMENRQKQIGTMNRRMEEIRADGEEMKVEMESLISESDEKMERLSAFYQLVEKMIDGKGNSPDSTEDELFDSTSKKKSAKGGSAVADWKRDGILSLYLNHKWEPDLIADRMKIDPAVVRAVISSHV